MVSRPFSLYVAVNVLSDDPRVTVILSVEAIALLDLITNVEAPVCSAVIARSAVSAAATSATADSKVFPSASATTALILSPGTQVVGTVKEVSVAPSTT